MPGCYIRFYPPQAMPFYVFRPLNGKHKEKQAPRSLRLSGEYIQIS